MKKLFNKQRAALALATIMMVSIIAGVFAANTGPTFSDVPTNHWAYTYIERSADEGWMNGVGSNQFNPGGTVTNAEFFTMLGRAYYAEEAAAIEAEYTGGNWWYPASKAAHNNGVLEGTDLGIYVNAYGAWPDNVLFATTRRDDMALAIYNLMEDKGFTASQSEMQAAQSKIGDWSSIKEKYQDPVSAVYALGIITGTSDGTFAPERGMTRAEAATVLCRLDDVLAGKEPTTPDIPDEEVPEVTPEPEPSQEPETPTSYAPGDANKDGVLTEEEVYDALMAFKEEVPDGTPWGNDVRYVSVSGAGTGTGCAAFVYKASDQAFSGPKRAVADANDLRVGDIVWNKAAGHWFIVTGISGDNIDCADGNTNGMVSWNGYGFVSDIEAGMKENLIVIYTRYPE